MMLGNGFEPWSVFCARAIEFKPMQVSISAENINFSDGVSCLIAE